MLLICCIVTFFACFIGTIGGMGGGIIIKPVLDATGLMSVATITFLSGCTVIAMTCWNVGKNIVKKESVLEFHTTVVLAIGASLGGILGKQLFSMVAGLFADQDMAGGVQAALLFTATLATLIYTLKKDKIQSRYVTSQAFRLVIGLLLGVLGSFLGIGGGPFNVAVLSYFFSMPTKKATQNSLFIVLLSQLTSTLKTVLGSGIPQFDPLLLAGMMVLGILGSEVGRRVNKKIDNRQATVCLEGVMVLIMAINIFNVVKFLG